MHSRGIPLESELMMKCHHVSIEPQTVDFACGSNDGTVDRGSGPIELTRKHTFDDRKSYMTVPEGFHLRRESDIADPSREEISDDSVG
jgi:hypothetical protein